MKEKTIGASPRPRRPHAVWHLRDVLRSALLQIYLHNNAENDKLSWVIFGAPPPTALTLLS